MDRVLQDIRRLQSTDVGSEDDLIIKVVIPFFYLLGYKKEQFELKYPVSFYRPNRNERLANLLSFHLRDSDRLYIDAGIIPTLAHGEYSRLFNCGDDISVEVTYGFSSRSSEHTARETGRVWSKS